GLPVWRLLTHVARQAVQRTRPMPHRTEVQIDLAYPLAEDMLASQRLGRATEGTGIRHRPILHQPQSERPRCADGMTALWMARTGGHGRGRLSSGVGGAGC